MEFLYHSAHEVGIGHGLLQRLCIKDITAYRYKDQEEDLELPPGPVMTWAGFDWNRVEVEIDGVMRTVYDHNDAGCTFAEIADAIEAQL